MTAPPMFHGFDGLMTLSRREGVDIRPTLLRVLTDLYVQTPSHSRDEDRQFVELASRLIDEGDDATRAAVSARLSIYPNTPRELQWKLGLRTSLDDRLSRYVLSPPISTEEPEANVDLVIAPQATTAPTLSMKPDDASQLITMFVAANASERHQILHNLTDAPLKPSTRVDPRRAARALPALEQHAMARNMEGFTAELADALILTSQVANQIVNDNGGEALACALKTLDMPADAFQRVLLFLNPALGASVMDVYRLARLYDTITERAALILLSAWRGASLASTRAKYRAGHYDDERARARPAAPQARPSAQPSVNAATRTTSRG
ncbi:MAG: DUF2336 domain-containing protein [Afipia sp.]|nr:DUF2336 domain-containing protein [Afipia sp.]